MAIFGGIPYRKGKLNTLWARVTRLGVGITPPASGIDTTALNLNSVPVRASDVSIISGAAHSPALADHGKTFIYTNAGAVTVTLPAASGLFAGWNIGLVSASTGVVTVNRSSTDVVVSKNTSLTSMLLPTVGDGGRLYLDSVGGSAKFYWQGKRSKQLADFAATVSTDTAAPHTLGVVPDYIKTQMLCTIINLNYAVNDLVELGVSTTSTGGGYVYLPDATNLNFKTVNSPTSIPNKTTFISSAITAADWNYRVTAYAIN